MKSLALLGLACMASAHTAFTTLFIDGKDQGDGTCVRMPLDPQTATAPIDPIDGADMACGRDGGSAVQYTCPAQKGALLTFEFRLWPDYEQPGSIDPGHLGPCAVYLKKMDSMEDPAAGPGWFKIWEDGYNQQTGKWCVDTLIQNNGLLSVQMPQGLPAGSYLVRPEILALHNAWRGDPQFYVGCAQIFLQTDVAGPLAVPANQSVSIPGYVDAATPGLTYNIYDKVLPPYPIPGPEVFIPEIPGPAVSAQAFEQASSQQQQQQQQQQKEGAIPSDCLIKNANWCAAPLKPYSAEAGCYVAVEDCYAQAKTCYAAATPAGSANCKLWEAYCVDVSGGCDAGAFNGPPKFVEAEHFAAVPGPIPKPWNNVFQPEAQQGQHAVAGPVSPVLPSATTKKTSTTTPAVKAPSAVTPAPSPPATVTSFITVTVRTTATVTAGRG